MTRQGTFHLDLSRIGAEPLGDEDPRQIGALPIKAVLGSGGLGRVNLGVSPQGYATVKRPLPNLSNDLAVTDCDSSDSKQLRYDSGAV